MNTFWLIFGVAGLLALPAFYIFYTINGASKSKVIGWTLGLMMLAVALSWYGLYAGEQSDERIQPDLFRLIALCSIPLLGTPYAISIFQKWVGSKRKTYQSMAQCVVDWFSISMLIGAAFICAAISIGLQVSLLNCLVMAVGLLALYPLYYSTIGPIAVAGVSSSQPEPSVLPERLYILEMVEQGKISAVEAAELLMALPEPTLPANQLMPVEGILNSSAFWTQVTGLAIFVGSFFMTWIHVPDAFPNLNQIIEKTNGGAFLSQSKNGDYFIHASRSFPQMSVDATGFQIKYGWIAIAAMVICLIVSMLIRELPYHIRRILQITCTAICACILLYIFGSTAGNLQFGAIIALAGFAIQVVGLIGHWHNGRRDSGRRHSAVH